MNTGLLLSPSNVNLLTEPNMASNPTVPLSSSSVSNANEIDDLVTTVPSSERPSRIPTLLVHFHNLKPVFRCPIAKARMCAQDEKPNPNNEPNNGGEQQRKRSNYG
jgi:hypothetical protein